MKGTISTIRIANNGKKYGFILGADGNSYYFDRRFLLSGFEMDIFHEGEAVEFLSNGTDQLGRLSANSVATINTIDSESLGADVGDMSGPIKYYGPGFSRHLDAERIKSHLKTNSGEYEVLKRLSAVLYIPYISSHNMGHDNYFPFCLVGATEALKQYVRGKYEFLLIFSHFRNEDWQHNTLKVSNIIRRRKEIADRRPLVNFYILVSNARNLKAEIDKVKGGTEAAIIPFGFDEILNCTNNDSLLSLLSSRFDEYLFENNMLGEKAPIDEDVLLFGDRGKIADSIVQRCVENKHSGIFGLRRSGKTSVLRAVQRRLSNAAIKHIVIESRSELESISSWVDALFDIARRIRVEITGLKRLPSETRAEFDKRLGLLSTLEDYRQHPTRCFVEDVTVYTSEEKTFVIAIDEIELITYNTASSTMWQELESYKSFWGALRDTGCALIVCGVNSTINERSIIEYKGKTCDNPMYERIHNCADFSKTYLPVFTDGQTKYMINTLGGYSNIAFNYVYVDINRAFGGQPYAIRQFCAFLYEQVKSLRKPHELYEIKKPTVDALLVEFCNSEHGVQLFNTILQHILIYSDEYAMLKRIALSPDKYRSIELKDIALIDHLEKYGLIEFDRTTQLISFSIQSVQEYICKTAQKSPEDMDDHERRQYIQDRVARCEKKLKRYIYDYYRLTGSEQEGRCMMQQYINRSKPKIMPKTKSGSMLDASTCKWKDFFEHDKFIIYFSTLRIIMVDNWRKLGKPFEQHGIDKNKFEVSMKDLNAGRTDADHYDAEDINGPDDWEISNATMKAFILAYETISSVLEDE